MFLFEIDPGLLCRLMRRLRRHASDDEGSVNVLLVGVLVVLITVGLVIMIPLGDAIADRRNSNTASDSAALAAAGYCADKLEDAYGKAIRASDGKGFWEQFGKPVSFYCEGASQEAARYAQDNGATLTALVAQAPLRYSVSVEMNDEVGDTGLHSPSKASAELSLTKGLCLKNNRIGVRAEGRCMTSPDDRQDKEENRKEGGEGRRKGDQKRKDNPPRPSGYAQQAEVDTRLIVS